MRLIENKTTTREEWLVNCTDDLRENLFKDKGHEIPTDVKVSCGFPSRNAREGKKQAVGVCHPRSHSKDNVNEIFLNPCANPSSCALAISSARFALRVMTGTTPS